MTFLRVVLGLLSALALVAFVLIMTVGKGIESASRSGAASENLQRIALAFGLPCLFLAMLVSVFVPRAALFLRFVAAAVVCALAGSLYIARENTGEGLLYASFFALWLVYFGFAASIDGR